MERTPPVAQQAPKSMSGSTIAATATVYRTLVVQRNLSRRVSNMASAVQAVTGAGVVSTFTGLRPNGTPDCCMMYFGRERHLHGHVSVAPEGAYASVTAASGRSHDHRFDCVRKGNAQILFWVEFVCRAFSQLGIEPS